MTYACVSEACLRVSMHSCTGIGGMESHRVDRPEAENIQKDHPTPSLVAGEIEYLYAHSLQLTGGDSHKLNILIIIVS